MEKTALMMMVMTVLMTKMVKEMMMMKKVRKTLVNCLKILVMVKMISMKLNIEDPDKIFMYRELKACIIEIVFVFSVLIYVSLSRNFFKK